MSLRILSLPILGSLSSRAWRGGGEGHTESSEGGTLDDGDLITGVVVEGEEFTDLQLVVEQKGIPPFQRGRRARGRRPGLTCSCRRRWRGRRPVWQEGCAPWSGAWDHRRQRRRGWHHPSERHLGINSAERGIPVIMFLT